MEVHSRYLKNIPLLYFITGVRSFMLIMPVVSLFFQQEVHLSLGELFLIQALFGISVFLLEVPSGYLADRISRRGCVIGGCFVAVIGMTVYASASSVGSLIAAEFLLAVALSLVSGADSALIYDSLLCAGQEGQYTKITSRLTTISGWSEAISGIAGGLLAAENIRFPFFGEAVVGLFACAAALFLIETPIAHRGEGRASSLRAVVTMALKGDAGLSSLLLYAASTGASTLTVVWLLQPYLYVKGLAIPLFGFVWCFLNVMVGVGAFFVPKLLRRFSSAQLIKAICPLIASVYCTLFIFERSIPLWGVVPIIALFFYIRGMSCPLYQSAVNSLVESNVRATVLSIQSMVFRLFFAVLGPIVGYTAQGLSFQWGFLCAAALYGSMGLFFIARMIRTGVLHRIAKS